MNEPLRRREPDLRDAGSRTPDDASIPLLTERLSVPPTLPPLDLDTTLPPSAQPVRIELPVQQAPASDSPSAMPTPSSAAQWTRIEIELRESVLKALSEQLPQNVEDIVRRHLSGAAEAALREMIEPLVARLAAEARLALASSMREIVDRAVKSELARLKSLKK